MKTIIINHKYDKTKNKILDMLCFESKCIYNLSIFCIQFFQKFKVHIFNHVKEQLLSINKNEMITIDIFKNCINISIAHFFQFYKDNRKQLDENNDIIFKYIKTYLADKEITNNNFDKIKLEITKQLDSVIKYNSNFKNIFYDDIIKNILDSFYIKHFNLIKYQIENHLPVTCSDIKFIQQVKKDNNIIKETRNKDCKTELLNLYNLDLKSFTNQAIVTRFIHSNITESKLTYDLIHEIIARSFQNLTSYYSLIKKGLKSKIPKYLKNDEKFNLIFTYKMMTFNSDCICLNLGENVGNNYTNIAQNSNLINITKCLYIDKKYLKIKTTEEKEIKKFYTVNYDNANYYVKKDDNNIIQTSKFIIKNKKVNSKEIKRVEIVPIHKGMNYKICVTYGKKNEVVEEDEEEKTVKKNKTKKEKPHENVNLEQMISIDLGVKNLITIFDPTGDPMIISGRYFNSMNKELDEQIDKEKSKSNNIMTKKLSDLIIRKENKVTNYFNLITKWLYKKYKDKKKIIIGYIKEWKTSVNLGKRTNRKKDK